MKKILITGSTSGIGLGLTQRLLADNYSVVGVGRCHDAILTQNHKDNIDNTAIISHSKNYFPYHLDFSQMAILDKSLKIIKKDHPDITALICCAGYGQFGELEQFSSSQIYDLMNVNFTSQAIVVKTLLPLLKAQLASKIIFLGSEAALTGSRKGSIYCASKFALRGLSQSLRQECRKSNIGITMINPGLVRSSFFNKLNFKPGEEINNALEISQVVDALYWVLKAPPHCVIEEINLQPMHPKVVNKINKKKEIV